MRVLHIYQKMDRPEREIILELVRHGIELDVMCHPLSPGISELREAGVQMYPFSCRSKLDFSAIRKIRGRLLEKTKSKKPYDLVHAFVGKTVGAMLLATRRLNPCPKLVAYRGAIGNVKRFDPGSQLSFLNSRLSAITCVAKAVADDLAGVGVPKHKLHTIYKGHRIDWYHFENCIQLTEFGVPPGAIVVGCVANFRASKGGETLLRAFSQVLDLKNLHLVLVGENRDPKMKQLLNQEQFRGRVHALGYQPNAAQLAGLFDIFILSSRNREGLSKGTIEAMSQGVPPIVTAVGGSSELVRHMVDGLVVARDSVNEMASAIRLLTTDSDLRKQLGAHARERIATSFSIDQTVAEHLKLYHELA